jgi:hypothetical protein
MTLTSRQLLALRFIATSCAAGLPPTRLEINAHLGGRSRAGHFVQTLSRLGLIEQTGTARGIRMTAEGWIASGVRTRGQLLEELAREVELWTWNGMSDGMMAALNALRAFDAASERAA